MYKLQLSLDNTNPYFSPGSFKTAADSSARIYISTDFYTSLWLLLSLTSELSYQVTS